jgi:hypothetical protein
VAPSTLAPPSFPTDFVPEGPKLEEGAASTAIPDKLTFSFYLPHATVNSKQQVLILHLGLHVDVQQLDVGYHALLCTARSLWFHD